MGRVTVQWTVTRPAPGVPRGRFVWSTVLCGKQYVPLATQRHWLLVESYIGISGAVIKPKLYIPMGVSGQIQHIYGIRDTQLIVAVDINEKASIFEAADYGIVGDMY